MAASPSSSSGAGGVVSVWLYQNDGRTRVTLVDINAGDPPPLIQFPAGGNFYVWDNVFFVFRQTVPFVPSADLGAPQISVVANPQGSRF